VTGSPSLAQALHGSGSRDYDWRQAEQVLAVIHGVRRAAPLTVSDLVARTVVPGRTVRQILSDADGEQLLLGAATGYFDCDVADDGDSLTAAFRSQRATMSARVDRRDRFALRLPRRQGLLL
jgi:hypothetical protein